MSKNLVYPALLAALLLPSSLIARSMQPAVPQKQESSAARPAKSKTAAQKPAPAKGSKTKAAKPGSAKAKASKPAPKSKTRKISSARSIRVIRAFRATSDLRPMAQQLIESRTPAAYAGVTAYAVKHSGTDAASLAWLAIGYARLLDRDPDKAQPALAKAQAHAGELADYVRYFQAQAYLGLSYPEKAVTTLKEFQKNAPDSIFVRDAVPLYANALIAAERPQEAVVYLEANRLPQRADIELALGRACLRASNTVKGFEVLRHIYFTLPLSAEADAAAAEMRAQGSSLAGSYAERKTRADLLAKGSRWADAAAEYRALMGEAPAEDRGNLQVLLGVALRSSRSSEGARLIETAEATGEANAQKRYQLGEIARTADDESAVKANLEIMRREAATSPWFEQALVSAGNMYLLKRDFEHAEASYREAAQLFPKGARASYTHWKAAWLSYRLNRLDDARRDFTAQVADYPSGTEVPAALYWRARIAEREGDTALARAWYTKCGQRFKNYYYGVLSRERVAALPGPVAAPVHDALLDRIPATPPIDDGAAQTEPPSDDLRLEKSRLLANAGLTEFAVRELQAVDGGKGANWATLQIAQLYRDAGQHHRALQFLKRAIPNYYSLEISELPQQYWTFLFPTPYWADVRKYAKDNGLDPYLVASLIRQESEFNPSAVSHANALGLMQLLPAVGKGEAKALKVKKFRTDALLTPAINIQLGTRYFREMVDQYQGQVEFALAAYNAGSNRVDEWRALGDFHDVPEFVSPSLSPRRGNTCKPLCATRRSTSDSIRERRMTFRRKRPEERPHNNLAARQGVGVFRGKTISQISSAAPITMALSATLKSGHVQLRT